MLPDLEEEKPKGVASTDEFAERFLEDYIHTQKARIESRQLIQEMLFFASCQVASASLAVLLFQFAVEVVFTSWLCLFVAWIPSMSALTEVNFNRTDEGWTLKIMNRPLTAIIKFSMSVGIVTFTILKIQNEITATNEAINAVYAEIERYESPNVSDFLPPFTAQAFFASMAIVGIVAIIRSWKNRNPWGD
jgi:flagellar biosynthesis protein FlhB